MRKNLFAVKTPLETKVKTTREYWKYIIEIKHPVMKGKEKIIIETLQNPEEIRRSKIDKDVFLYYRRFDKLYCAVVKQQNKEGFLITCYPADKIKEGETIWKK